jgi:glyoxylase-like metal-dependent hydrolase (beta-lactamase superfamily II)
MTIAPLVFALALAQPAATPSHPNPPTAKELAPDTFLIPGAMLPDRGPDGNTVVYIGPSGLVVVDTGRHPWHSDGIVAFARSRRLPVSVIVNTHWHLDHSSGNRRVKAVYPDAKVYTSRAVDRAIAPGGFLTRNLDAARDRVKDPALTGTRREETELFLATMDAAQTLKADVPVERSETMTLAGKPLSVRLAANAVTDGDVWLYDEKTGIAVIGDLVTLPAPFFETACPARWQTALDEVWATPFRLAVPGHGDPMTRADFDTYRGAFGKFRSCVGTDSTAAACAAGWTKDVGPLLESDADRKQATEYATYYVDFLRKGSGASADCQAK